MTTYYVAVPGGYRLCRNADTAHAWRNWLHRHGHPGVAIVDATLGLATAKECAATEDRLARDMQEYEAGRAARRSARAHGKPWRHTTMDVFCAITGMPPRAQWGNP